MPALLSPQI
ncbi:unnamed protein product, partial [Didymodactylos carnosus]